MLLKQIEACLKCIEKQNLKEVAVKVTRDLLIIYNNVNPHSSAEDKSRLDAFHNVLLNFWCFAPFSITSYSTIYFLYMILGFRG